MKSGWHNLHPILNYPGGPWRRGVSEKSSRRGSLRGTPPQRPFRCQGSGTLRALWVLHPHTTETPLLDLREYFSPFLDTDAESDPTGPGSSGQQQQHRAHARVVPSPTTLSRISRGVSDPGRVGSRPPPTSPPPPPHLQHPPPLSLQEAIETVTKGQRLRRERGQSKRGTKR